MKLIVLPLKTIGFHTRFQSYQVQLEASARENMNICHQKESYIPTNLCTPYGNRAGGKCVGSQYECDTNNWLFRKEITLKIFTWTLVQGKLTYLEVHVSFNIYCV
jgi:hypothetical protein